MEMPVSYCFYSKIQEENTVWAGEARRARNIINIMQMERSGNYRRRSMRRPCTSEREHTAKDKHIFVYGIFEGQKHAYDL